MRFLLILLISSSFIFQGFTAKNNILPAGDNDTIRKNKKEVHFPELPDAVNRLFYVQRDPNTNTVVYELNLVNGQLDVKEPVHAYWIRYNEKGQKDELSYLQRHWAYGVTTKQLKADEYDVRFVCYKKLQLTLMKGSDTKYHIFMNIAKKQAILNRIFVRIEGGSLMIPNVVYVELKGTDPTSGKEVTERFKP